MIYKAEGIILKGRNLGEADRILIIYTKELGKISTVAKGVRRNRSKLRGATQPLTHIEMVLYKGRNLDTITQCEVKEMFIAIREDLDRWAYANYIIELLAAMVPERQPHEGVFVLFLTAMHLVAALQEPELGALFFAIHFLRMLGFQPEIAVCASCRQKCKEGQKTGLSGAFGGILCSDCLRLDKQAYFLQGGELAVWRQILRMDASLLTRLKLPAKLRARLGRALRYYLQYQLERRLKSAEFLQHLHTLDQDKNFSFKEN